MKSNYRETTAFIYGSQTWGALFPDGDGEHIAFTDNNCRRYIEESLAVMKITTDDMHSMKVFNIGTGREARIFRDLGAKFVTHFDIAPESVAATQRYIAAHCPETMESVCGDIQEYAGPLEEYDIIFLAGIYQHLEVPARGLINLMRMLKNGGKMYMGFYRSGEWKYFIGDTIRYLLEPRLLQMAKDCLAISCCFAEPVHYQAVRALDDFFVPCAHKFHPDDVIHDIRRLGGEVWHIDDDRREYHHESNTYFSIGADRIYVRKTGQTPVVDPAVLLSELRTRCGRDQMTGVSYIEPVINENLELVRSIKCNHEYGVVSDQQVVMLAVGMYQLTRPFVPEQNEYYQATVRDGRHATLNRYLKNFVRNYCG